MGNDTEYDDAGIVQSNEGRANQSIIIDTGKSVAVVAICAALCGIASALSVWSAYTATRAEKEVRLQQYYLLELDAKVIKAGIKQPSDSIAAQMAEKGRSQK